MARGRNRLQLLHRVRFHCKGQIVIAYQSTEREKRAPEANTRRGAKRTGRIAFTATRMLQIIPTY